MGRLQLVKNPFPHLEDVFSEHIIQAVLGLEELFLVEAGEHGLEHVHLHLQDRVGTRMNIISLGTFRDDLKH